MRTELALMAVYEKTRLTLREIARELGIAYNTARNQRAQGRLPIPMAGHPLTASVKDVADHLDSLRAEP